MREGSTFMSFGNQYADIYDALYREKDYATECAFVLERLESAGLKAKSSLLDIGCGTGRHALLCAEKGYRVTGVDAAPAMLALAEARRAIVTTMVRDRTDFLEGDARTFALDRKFEGAMSLFHVMSYMAAVGDFDSALRAVRAHLKPGGSFLFDFWYGPAVLALPPERRERDVVIGSHRIKRITKPTWYKDRNVIVIDYDIFNRDVETNAEFHTNETHTIRYFFDEDLKRRLTENGFEILEIAEWLTGKPPGKDTFGVYTLARVR
jgi:SAM-dependent methyltransferase